jgi:LysM repeat protein
MKTLQMLPLLLSAAVSGCVTFDSNTDTARQDLEINNLKASIESMDRASRDSDVAMQKIIQDLETLKSASRSDAQRIAELENQVKNAALAKDQMRKEIIADLSKSMAELMKSYYQTAPGRSSSRQNTAVAAPANDNTPSRGGSKVHVVESVPVGSESQSGSREHVVAAGQSITKIASIYGVSVNAILSANNISNPNMVRAGQKLIIPK